MSRTERHCVCNHRFAAHVHYRRGSDCAQCGPDACKRYRASTLAMVIELPRYDDPGEVALALVAGGNDGVPITQRMRPSRSDGNRRHLSLVS